MQVQPGQSRSGQAGSECCHSPGDWRVRSVHSEKAGREDSAPKSNNIAMPTPFTRWKAASGGPSARGWPGSPESLARGMFSRGFSANPGELPTSPEYGLGYAQPKGTRSPGNEGCPEGSEQTLDEEKPVAKGDRRWQLWVGEQSYEFIVPTKVENRRAPARGGHGIHWREGTNR